ncbi:MAG: beta-lactamase family protein [Hyphomicrobiales bacterium]
MDIDQNNKEFLFRDPQNRGGKNIPRPEWDLPPWHKWTFQHIREMTPTEAVWRGNNGASLLLENKQELGSISFINNGHQKTIEEFLNTTNTSAFLVMHKNKIIAEKYYNGMLAHRPHLVMSVTKSLVATLANIIMAKGLMNRNDLVTDYLPELESTAYKGAKICNILNMNSGVVFDESYTKAGCHMVQLDLACGWKENNEPSWPKTIWELVLTLDQREYEHGEKFRYRSIETDVLAFALERCTKQTLSDLMSEEIWQPLGAEEDAYFTVDHSGYPLANGGFSATLRDLGRFALMMQNNGRFNDLQIAPKDWVNSLSDTQRDYHQDISAKIIPNGTYSDMYWIEDIKKPAFMARGIFGQYIYIDPRAEISFVKLSTHDEFHNPEDTKETLAAFDAIKKRLVG